ncbi:hypothetical protein Q3G72_014824 [Acer saccharum]|nr:hypothetical protein Q3G72_014824 [Acer saccharum]
MPRWTEQVKVCSGTRLEGPLDDGYCWRKYGQKDILGANFPSREKEARLSLVVVKMEKMWKTKGGVYVALLMMLVMILFINANPSRATSLVLKMSSNNSATGSGFSSIHDSLIADHQSLEFSLGPEMATKNMQISPGALVPTRPIVNCGRVVPHASCLPGSKNVIRGEKCVSNGKATGNRGCTYR